MAMMDLKHTAGALLRDKILDELACSPGLDTAHVDVDLAGSTARLTGEVESYPEKLLARTAAQRVRGVTVVLDEVTVRRGGVQLTDSDVSSMANRALRRSVEVPPTIRASVHDHVLILSGAGSSYGRTAAVRAVTYLPGVRDIDNRMTAPAGPSITESVSTALAAGIAATIRHGARVASGIAVSCDAFGTVTLDGFVNSFEERNRAEHIARDAPGARRVTDHLVIREEAGPGPAFI